MTYKNWHNSQKNPNIHLYLILAANWLKDLHKISQTFILLLDQLTEAITHAATILWHLMLLPDTFLDFESNKEDPYLSTSLFLIVLLFAKIQYFLFDKYLIFTMTIPIPSTEDFQLFKPHPIPIHLDYNTGVISSSATHTCIIAFLCDVEKFRYYVKQMRKSTHLISYVPKVLP